MTYAMLVRIDSEGEWPIILDDFTPLEGEEGVRFRYVAETDDEMEAVRIAEVIWNRLECSAQAILLSGRRRAAWMLPARAEP